MGTERQTPTVPQGTDALSQVLQQLNWQEPEAALLSAAGAIALHHQVGRAQAISLPSLPAIEPCEPDELPGCDRRIAKHLTTALQDYPEVLPELLSLIASAQQRVPPKQLPKLLDIGKQKAELRPSLLPVLGKRGQWLAMQNADWYYATPVSTEDFSSEAETFETNWQNGTRQSRLLFLQRWREIDSDGLRDFLAAEWSAETAKNRESFITVFAKQLSMGDECFLEKALEDRAKGVRREAIALLNQLPDSRLFQRMRERVSHLIQLSGRGKNLQISVTLPKAYDASWARDGIEKKPKNGIGERAGWLQQMVASAPLSMWQVEPTLAINKVKESEWRDVLLVGWAIAAKTQQDDYWAEGLLTLCGTDEAYQNVMSPLLSVLPVNAQKKYLKSVMPKTITSQEATEKLTHWLRLATEHSQRWDLAFSRLIFTQVVRLLTEPHQYGGILISRTGLALTLHPGFAPEATQIVNNLSTNPRFIRPWEEFFDACLGLLNLRWDIYQAFADTSKSR